VGGVRVGVEGEWGGGRWEGGGGETAGREGMREGVMEGSGVRE